MLIGKYCLLNNSSAGGGLKDSDGSSKQVFESTAHKHLNTGKKIVVDVITTLQQMIQVLKSCCLWILQFTLKVLIVTLISRS